MTKLKPKERMFVENVVKLCGLLDWYCDTKLACSECFFYGVGTDGEDDSVPCLMYAISVLGSESRAILKEQELYDD